MLLFTKKVYSDAIRAGTKLEETRRGTRYRNVKVGDWLSINGHFRVQVKSIERHDYLETECYRGKPGPYFIFKFTSPFASRV